MGGAKLFGGRGRFGGLSVNSDSRLRRGLVMKERKYGMLAIARYFGYVLENQLLARRRGLTER